MSTLTHNNIEKDINEVPTTVLEQLKHYFRHTTFKSDLQMKAVNTILKRKLIITFYFDITLTIYDLKENMMYLYRCQLDQESHCVINYLL